MVRGLWVIRGGSDARAVAGFCRKGVGSVSWGILKEERYCVERG